MGPWMRAAGFVTVVSVAHAARFVTKPSRGAADQLASVLNGTNSSAQHSQLQSARAASRTGSSLPVPQIRHYKLPGLGYTEESPLFHVQQVRERVAADKLAKQNAPGSVPPVSTTMNCVVFLTAQFFFVYTSFFVVQTLNRFKVVEREREEKCLASVAETVYFVPMLCVLFIAARMRAVQLSQGQPPEQYGLPPWWVKSAMNSCAWSLLVQTVIVYACSHVYGDMWQAAAKKQTMGLLAKLFVLARNLVMINIYASFTTVCVGVCVMQPPVELWGPGGGPEVSPAVFCTTFLAVMYFLVYLASACAKTANEIGLCGPTRRFSYAQEILKNATIQVGFAPMLCTLFIATRLRALQLDPVHGNPQHWVQVCFYVCTGSVFAQTLLAVAGSAIGVPVDFVDDGNGNEEATQSHKTVDAKMKVVKVIIDVMLFLLMSALYCALTAIMVGLVVMKSPSGSSVTMPTSLKCTVVLTCLYFAVFCSMWIVLLLAPRVKDSTERLAAFRVFVGEKAKEAVSFCPMFCVLFLGTLMRSLQITGGRGAPQEWCQNFMRVATWSIVLLTLARADAMWAGVSRLITNICTTLQYLCLALLYVCAVAVVVGLFVMTPENANGSGSFIGR